MRAHPRYREAGGGAAALARAQQRTAPVTCEHDLIGVEEAAMIVRVARRTITAAHARGDLRATSLTPSGFPLFDPEDVRAWGRKLRLIA